MVRISTVALLLAAIVASCVGPAPATTFSERVSAFTAGLVSNRTSISIRFSEPVAGATPGREADAALLDVSPRVEGTLMWADASTLVLRPERPLESGAQYDVRVSMSRLFKDEPDFVFGFKVRELAYSVSLVNLQSLRLDDLTDNVCIFSVSASDCISPELMQRQISAEQQGRPLELQWEFGTDEHTLTVLGVRRLDEASTLRLVYSGEVRHQAGLTHEDFAIPSVSGFEVMMISHSSYPDRYAELTFTMPIEPTQDLSGLVTVGDVPVRLFVDGNKLKVYPLQAVQGTHTLVVHRGIVSTTGVAFDHEWKFSVSFESISPQVELLTSGNILPKSTGLVLPFRAVSLRSVEVRVIKLFESNLPAFLQSNGLGSDDTDALHRAGRLVAKKTLNLAENRQLDLSKWNTFSIDLTQMMEPDPGAVYRVIFSFGRRNAIYPCADASPDAGVRPADDAADLAREQKIWDRPGYVSDDLFCPDDFEWNWWERNNPCHPMYYYEHIVGINLLASDIGIVAKAGHDSRMFVMLSDISTTAPLQGVDVDIYNFQNQIIGSGRSDSEGKTTIAYTGTPHLLVARNGAERGYLPVGNAESLSLSGFDVQGRTVDDGLKAFIYGERGVWRPGDSIFVSMMLQNRLDPLPRNVPVRFELADPHGRIVSTHTQPLDGRSLLSFRTATAADAETGTYTLRATVGATRFEKPLRIESVKPNRLRIEADCGRRLSMGQTGTLRLAARWLHGAPAGSLNARVTMTLRPSVTAFDKYPDYVFDDVTRTYEPSETTVFDGRLNADGNAQAPIDLPAGQTCPGMMKADFFVRVFESSGDFSVDRFDAPCSPYDRYVGIGLPKGDDRGVLGTDTDHRISVLTLSADGKPLSVKGVECEVYRLDWRWWWESGSRGLADYANSDCARRVMHTTVDTHAGKGSFAINVPADDWGRYLFRVSIPGGHSASATALVDWPWGLKPGASGMAAKILGVQLSADTARVGERVEVAFPSAGGGWALVSVENGTSVVETHRIATRDGFTRFDLTATAAMTPNVYVSVSMLQPHTAKSNDLPVRMYGVVPLMVVDASTRLTPVVDAPRELAPDADFEVEVSEKDGREMYYTIAVVEEGLLGLTRFATPDPWQHFFAREALGVRTWDVYDQVIGAYGGRIESVFGIGGDTYLQADGPDSRANRFDPVVIFRGPFRLKGGTATHRLHMPNYVGSVRVMVVACNGNACGSAGVDVPVRTPLMMLGTLPRVCSPDETLLMPVTIFSMSDKTRAVTVRLRKADGFEAAGSATRTLSMAPNSEAVVNYELRVGPHSGVGRVELEATAAGASARTSIEIDIRRPNPPQTRTVSAMVSPQASVTLSPTMLSADAEAHIEVSALPPLNLSARLGALMRYPHGCIEQITSAVFPQIYLPQLVDLTDDEVAAIAGNVSAGISVIVSRQLSDGGLGYWPASSRADEWGTSYAGLFISEAASRGYYVPTAFVSRWKTFQKKEAQRWEYDAARPDCDCQQAFRLLSLACNDAPDLASMNRMRVLDRLSPIARWMLAAAYARTGYADVASKIIDAVGTPDAGTQASDAWAGTYGSPTRDLAICLQTYCLMRQFGKAFEVVMALSDKLASDTWLSTQSAAYALFGISLYIEKVGSTAKTFAFDYSQQTTVGVRCDKPLYKAQLPSATRPVELTNRSDGPLAFYLTTVGTPAAGDEQAYSSELDLTVSYTDAHGNPLDVSSLPQGTDIVAHVSVSNKSLMAIPNVALTQVFPSGWEIRSTRLDAAAVSPSDYRDFRDDRVYTYFDMPPHGTRTFATMLHATYAGRFYLPAAKCEAMYDARKSAATTGRWVEVSDK